ncbi:MAG: S-layer homology domain-containing protein [Thermoleophilia bacterium]|nr:S-layer homology domain-containing protein [Thermoleophilia bacterium]
MKHRRWILTPLMALLFLLLVAPAALAAPPVDGWQTTSLSEDVGQGVHARMDEGHMVWVDGRTSAATPIVLLDVATGQREVIAPDGSSPEIAGDHIAYLGPGESSSSGRPGRDVFLYAISSGETRRLTNDAETRFNYRLSVQGDMVTWLSATRVGIEGPIAGDMSLLLHDIAKNQTVTLAAEEPGTGGPSFYVSDAEKVIWKNEPAWTPGEPALEVWFYSAGTGETREVPSLREYNIAALAGDILLAWRQWSTEGGVEHFVRYDLKSGERLPLDELLNGATPGPSLIADGSSFAWAGYADGSTYVALSDTATGRTKRISTTGYDVGGLVLRGDLLLFHGQFRGRYAGTNWNYLFVYDRARDVLTRIDTLQGSNDSYGTDGAGVAFTTANSWPYNWDDPQRLLLATPAASLAPAFLDVPGTHLYRTAIQGLKEREIVGGYPWADGIGAATGTVFRPDATLTRAQFAKMLALALDIPLDPSALAPFDDVASGLFPGAYVAALAERGIAYGTGPRTFSPYATLTRAQLMTLLVRAIDKVKPGVLGTPPMTPYPQGYRGALGSFDSTHAPFMLRAELNGLVDGLVGYGFGGKWDPWRPATRAEAAQALWNFLGKEGRPAPSTP